MQDETLFETAEGVEIQLGYYDYGARFYDPGIGRMLQVDPLAEDYSAWNPYNYVLNNPLKYTDPTGMSADTINPIHIDLDKQAAKQDNIQDKDIPNKGASIKGHGGWMIFGMGDGESVIRADDANGDVDAIEMPFVPGSGLLGFIDNLFSLFKSDEPTVEKEEVIKEPKMEFKGREFFDISPSPAPGESIDTIQGGQTKYSNGSRDSLVPIYFERRNVDNPAPGMPSTTKSPVKKGKV